MTRNVIVGMLIFPRLTQLDMTGPYEVLARCPTPGCIWSRTRMAPVKTDRGMEIVPTVTYADCPQLDVIMVPGGPGQQDLMEDAVVLEFLQRQARNAKYVTSVCTGSLVLGAAGLLKGKRATSHWAAIDHLGLLGAIPVSEKVVVDGNVVTGAGVTSGIDFALRLAAILEGEQVAREIQLQIEYDPEPPFNSGSPQHRGTRNTGGAARAACATERAAPRGGEPRRPQARRAAERLATMPLPTKLDHCVIHVSDWERSNAFYRDVLGAELVQREAGWAYRFGDKQLNVHGVGVRPAEVARLPVQPGNSDLCFEWTGPIEDAIAHLKKHNVAVEAGPMQRFGAKGNGTSVYFRDPDGSLMEFMSYQR